tara:strand:+ start:1279 stop:2409 length:1131 start_codon:yes stop_codon:yes gene_type:complete
LVSNGSFEQLTSCPSNSGQIDSAIGWWGVQSPDLLNSCATNSALSVPSNFDGTQSAYDGDGYIVFASYLEPPSFDAREYVQTQLIDSLEENKKYYLLFQISFGDILQYASDGIGAFLSMDTVYGVGLGQIIDSIPQVQVPEGVPIIDKTNWVQVDGCFIAKGGESFLTIGNFKHDSDLTIQSLGGGVIFGGYYLDDVQLYKVPAFKADSNHFICNGIIDSTFLDLSDTSEATTYSWSPINGLTNPTSPQTWAKPSVTTTYTLSQYTPCDTSTIDVTVYVGANACDSLTTGINSIIKREEVKLYPNPTEGVFIISINNQNFSNTLLEIYDVTGQLIFNKKLNKQSTKIDLSKQSTGLYFYRLTNDLNTYSGKLVIDK